MTFEALHLRKFAVSTVSTTSTPPDKKADISVVRLDMQKKKSQRQLWQIEFGNRFVPDSGNIKLRYLKQFIQDLAHVGNA